MGESNAVRHRQRWLPWGVPRRADEIYAAKFGDAEGAAVPATWQVSPRLPAHLSVVEILDI